MFAFAFASVRAVLIPIIMVDGEISSFHDVTHNIILINYIT